MIIPAGRRGLAIVIAAAAAIGGLFVAIHYHRLGLTLSHYDARGHLVVARRVFDSVTPGWQQIGAVWLPLPHLLNALPVQVDAFYRTGASAVALSVASFAVTAGAIAWIVVTLTGSTLAAIASAAVFTLNPNVLYLQATPMTEPLLLALIVVATAALLDWCATDASAQTRRLTRVAGWTLALACLTRYEAWPVAAAALATATWVRWRSGEAWRDAVAQTFQVLRYPVTAVAAFLVFSRVVVGEWFVAGGFFVPENAALGHPYTAFAEIVWGVRALSGYALVAAATAGAVALTVIALRTPGRSSAAVPLALLATAALPWLAFLDGHPYRIRYMVPLIAGQAVCAGFAAAAWRPLRAVGAALLVAAAMVELRPLDSRAPMVTEAQWDRPNVAVRQQVTDCLRAEYRGETVMASMGSLGHYMQELAASGFHVRDFLHEGNGDIWLAALNDPRPFAGWMLIEEKAEGGDMLAGIARENPSFLSGFSRVCEGAGLALYRRSEASNESQRRRTPQSPQSTQTSLGADSPRTQRVPR